MSTIDVLVVGGGPAGLAAASELKRLGVTRVVVLDREREAGGMPRHCHHTGFGVFDLHRVLTGPTYARRRRGEAEKLGVEILSETTALGFNGPTTIATTSPRGPADLEANAVLLATGCRERPRAARLVPGTRPLGVYTTGSLQQIVYARRASPGKRAVVVGAEHVSFSAAHTLIHGGATVAAIVTELAEDQTYLPLRAAIAYRNHIPIVTGTRVCGVFGKRRVEAVELVHIESGKRERLACDTVVFTGDWIPDHELARGADIVLDAATKGARVDGALRTSRRGVFAAGNLLHGAAIADVAALEGKAAARGIVAYLSSREWPADRVLLPIHVEPPLAWITPSVLVPRAAAPPRHRFVFQTREFRTRVTVEVRQDGDLLHSEHFARLVPNRALDLSADWSGQPHDDRGPITVALR